jgi:hypothetical protein
MSIGMMRSTMLKEPRWRRILTRMRGDLSRLLGGDHLLGDRNELPVDAGAENVARLDVEVGRALLDRGPEDFLHNPRAFEEPRPSPPGPPL